MRDIKNIIKQMNNAIAPILKINRDLEANFSAIRQMNNSIFSYHDEFARHLQEMTLDIPNISIGLNNNFLDIFAEFNKNFYSNIDEINKILQPVFKNQKVFDSIFFEIEHSFQQNLQEFFSKIDKEVIEAIENSEIKFTNDDLRIIDKQAEFIYGLMPDSKELIESYRAKNNFKFFGIIIRCLFNFLLLCFTFSSYQYDANAYKINRDNVRIRETPDVKNDKNIMCKLNKNISVIKIDSENGWVKVRFEQSEGVEKEGWVYNNMLSKVK